MAFVVPASSETQTDRYRCYNCNVAQVFELALLPADCERAAQLAALCYGFAGHLRSHAEFPAIWFAAQIRWEPDADFDSMAVAENCSGTDLECLAVDAAQCSELERRRNSDD